MWRFLLSPFSMMTLPVFGQGSCNCTAPEVSESVSSPLEQATALPAECSRWVGSLAPSMTLLSPIQNLLLHLVSSLNLSTWSSSPEGLNNTVNNNRGSSWGGSFKWGEGRLSDLFTANFVSASHTKESWGPPEPSSSFAWMIVSSTRQEPTDSPNTLQRRLRWLLRAQG